MRGEAVQIRNPRATRPWQHVLEPLNGYLMVAERLYNQGVAYAEAWNFGPNDNGVETVGWIADRLYQLWGNGLVWQRDAGTTHAHENTFLKLDCSKAQARLGWQPQLDLHTTLQWIVIWTKAYQAGANMRAITEGQIRQFMAIGAAHAATSGEILEAAPQLVLH
jgi:CDP-glucose 4,6-dehydratase